LRPGGTILEYEFNPIRLKKGVYEIVLMIEREDAEGGGVESIHRFVAQQRLNIVSPLPYPFLTREFRLVVELDHRWESARPHLPDPESIGPGT
jgi:hypothetical protein